MIARSFVFFIACVSLAGTAPNYTISDVPVPPSRHGSTQIDGIEFLPDGRLAVCLPSGEIFFRDVEKGEWQLFAEGLHNPLGMYAVSNTEVVVAQRPELTRVRDLDGDGKADDHEVITDAFGMSGNYHEFNFTPVRDTDGGIYFGLGTGSRGNGVRSIVRGKFDPRGRPGRMHASTPYRGCVVKYTADGKTIPWSYGHRTPNGLGMDLEGNLFVTDNQGDWVGTSKLFHVQKGRFYGHAASLTWKEGFAGTPIETPVTELAKLRSRAAVVFPHGSMANSPTEVLAITPEAKIGPFTGQLLVGEMNKGRIMRVMLEKVDGELQGACVPFFDGSPLRSGCNRMAWAPDGSLYVGHTKHTWAGNQGISRIAWDGTAPFEVQNMTLTDTGFRLRFTEAVDPAIAAKPETWAFKRYYYAYQERYGSPQSDLSAVEVVNVAISEAGKVVDLTLKELEAWHVHELSIAGLKSASGRALTNNFLAYTLNRLLQNTPPEPLQAVGVIKKKPVAPIPPTRVKGTVYQAESAKLKGPALQDGNEGFSGASYADFGSGKEAIEWTVNAEAAGDHELLFRYSVVEERPLQLVVNGAKLQILPFPSTDSWKTWKDAGVQVRLTKGKNVVRLETTGKSGGNFDMLQVVALTDKPKKKAERKRAAAVETEWVDLLQNDSLALWQKTPTTEIGEQWSVKDGVLHLDKETKGRGGQIVTKKPYYDFELKFDFRISKGGNSGVKYRTKEGIGLEYQVLDDVNHTDNKNPTHRTACMYELASVPDSRTLNPPGEWNQGRIVARGNTLEHWLNGEKVVSIEYGSAIWKERFAASKYTKYPDFAAAAGPILLQDHSDTVSYRKLRIREFADQGTETKK
ncbi:MAG: glucose/arabinose dehydrogenase [Rhodothermales bacterium]|jgi:glucose/arabinose dehydrogenase